MADMSNTSDEMNKPNKRRLTLFPKLVIALVIVVAPLYVIAILMNQLGESRLKDELSKSLELKVDFYMNSLEIEHEHMLNLLQEYTIDRDIQHVTYLHETMELVQFTDAVRRIQHKLEQLKGSSMYAKSVNAHILTLHRSMSSETSINETLSLDFAAVEPLVKENGSGIFYWEERMFLAISYPSLRSLVSIEPGFILTVELDLEVMRNVLTAFDVYEQSGAALIFMSNDLLLASNETHDIVSALEARFADKYEQGDLSGLEQMTFNNNTYVIAYNYSTSSDYYLASYIPTDNILGPIDTFKSLIWLLSFIAFIIIIAYSYWIYRLIHRPLQNLVKAFRRVDQRQLSFIDLPKPNDEFLYLFQRFNVMVHNLNELIHQVYEQKLRAQSSELKQLQAQINPHFLYNTYFILYRLAKMNDNESIAKFSQYLGEYFQYITRNASDESSLEMEFKHSRTYAEIQNIRFKNRIQVEITELTDELKSYRVPRLFLQPIVENAYKYGLETRRKEGHIKIDVQVDSEVIFIIVEDNGEHLADESIAKLQYQLMLQGNEMEYTGLLNVQRRLQIYFGESYGIEVSRSDLGGMKVQIKLPKQHHKQSMDRIP